MLVKKKMSIRTVRSLQWLPRIITFNISTRVNTLLLSFITTHLSLLATHLFSLGLNHPILCVTLTLHNWHRLMFLSVVNLCVNKSHESLPTEALFVFTHARVQICVSVSRNDITLVK